MLLGHVRIGKPLEMKSRPYRVAHVRPEGAQTWTVVLEPLGHPGIKFRAGQFAWLTLGSTPFSLQQHPFSFSSSAAQSSRIEFAIRELGDFTSTIKTVKPGTTAFVEGPYGAFVPDFDRKEGLFLIAGGVGIAPMMSMLRTMRDRKDRRPVILIYGNHSLEETIFKDELGSLQQELDLNLVLVFSRIGEELLERHLPRDRNAFDYFTCGPTPMMDLVEGYLNRSGVPVRQIHSERFDIA
jgi:predicted ferric reductase